MTVRPALHVTVPAALILLLSGYWYRQITESPIRHDAAGTTTMAVNLSHHRVISRASTAPITPTMFREPVPALITAVAVALIDSRHSRAELDDYLRGERARYLKLQNIAWIALLCAGTFAALWWLTSSVLLGATAIMGVNITLPLLSPDTILNELPAAAMLMLASLLLARGYAVRSRTLLFAAGATFGILALTKAPFAYVFVAVVGSLAIIFVVRRGVSDSLRLSHLAFLALAFAMVVTPWMVRNYVQLDAFQITERGGRVLVARAYKNQMSLTEYRGSFYVWAPNRLKPIIGPVLGFGPADMLRGGRLQRLNPTGYSDFYQDELAAMRAADSSTAITYLYKYRAEAVRIQREREAAGFSDAATYTDRVLRRRAVEMILSQPLRHLAMALPLLWRGALLPFPLLALAMIYAARRRRAAVLVFGLPALLMIAFYALASHFVLRYGTPALPVAIVAGLASLHLWWRHMRPVAS